MSRLKATIHPEELGRLFAELNLPSIPPEHRKAAINDLLQRVMIATLEDRKAANEIASARLANAPHIH
jgi:hypothetical protein